MFADLVSGITLGPCDICKAVCVQHYFNRHRALAMGMVAVGGGTAFLVFGALTRILANVYGWRGAVLLNAGLLLQCVPLSAAFRAPPHRKNSQHAGDKENIETAKICRELGEETDTELAKTEETDTELAKTDETVMGLAKTEAGTELVNADVCDATKFPNKMEHPNTETHPAGQKTAARRNQRCSSIRKTHFSYFHQLSNIRFDMYLIGTLLCHIGMMTLLFHTPNRAVQSGIDKTRASLLTTIVGGATLLGRIAWSLLANIERVSIVLCYGLSALLGGLAIAAMVSDSFTGLAVGSALGGLCCGKLMV